MPKQLLPFIGGKSLLQIAYERLDGLVPAACRYICAGESHRRPIAAALPDLQEGQILGEPEGRDTLAALAFSAAIIEHLDPEAVVAVFTADHLIEPVEDFQKIVEKAYEIVESAPHTLVTFGITPTYGATGFGYIELGEPLHGDSRAVREFREKPDRETAEAYVAAGPDRYLWNSGMLVWRARSFLDCVERYEPELHAGICRIADAWGTDTAAATLAEVYPGLKKISVDFAILERASTDPAVSVAALPMPLTWLDVGSWPAYADTCPADEAGNRTSGGEAHFLEGVGTIAVSSDPEHLIATIGCKDLIIVHTPEATLVCPRSEAEKIKELHQALIKRFGDKYV